MYVDVEGCRYISTIEKKNKTYLLGVGERVNHEELF